MGTESMPSPDAGAAFLTDPPGNSERGIQMRMTLLGALVLSALALAVPAAWAGSPHFVDDTVTATQSGNTLTVSGKEAGLGDEAQVHIVVTATALCINPGSNHPKAANKESV
jgi:hypothetical protein